MSPIGFFLRLGADLFFPPFAAFFFDPPFFFFAIQPSSLVS